MRALLLENRLRLVEGHPIPQPAPGDALIRVSCAGICGTDLELLRGYGGFRGIPGHEFVGIVEQHPDSAWVGRRVVGEINLACGQCRECRAGRRPHCLDRRVLGIHRHDGAFADYLTLPAENLHQVPPDLPDEVAVFTEPLAAVLQVLEQVSLRPTDRLIVLGDGKLGLLCAQVLARTACRLMVVGHHSAHLEEAARRWACDTLLLPAGQALPADQEPADVVVDCTGSPAGLELALELVRPRGTVVLKSTYHGRAETNLTRAVVNEITLVGSRCGPFQPALRLLAQGEMDVLPLLHARYPLSQALAALERAARPGTLKVLLEMR